MYTMGIELYIFHSILIFRERSLFPLWFVEQDLNMVLAGFSAAKFSFFFHYSFHELKETGICCRVKISFSGDLWSPERLVDTS